MTDQSKPAEAGATGAEAKTEHTPEETQELIRKLRNEAKQNRLAAEAAAAKLLEKQKADEEREEQWLKEQGDFKALYEKQMADLEKLKVEASTATTYQSAFKASLDARIAAIPEGMRSLVPEGLDPLKLSEWLDKNAALLSNRKAPNLDAGAGGSAAGVPHLEPTADDIEQARKFRMSLDDWMKMKAEAARTKRVSSTDIK